MSFESIAARVAMVSAILVAPLLLAPPLHAQILTLQHALQRALATSPRLTAAERDVGIAYGMKNQAGALINPEISYEQDNSLGSGSFRGTRSAETTLQISQLFELFGRRDARIAVGDAALDAATIERKAIRLQALSETAIAFIAVLAGQQRIKILDDQAVALDRLAPLLLKRIDAGASSPAEIARAEVASDFVKADRERARTALDNARRELAVLVAGEPVARFNSVAGRLDATGVPPAFTTVVAAIDAHPQLAQWTAVYAQRNAELLLARLKPYPDVRLAAGWRHFNDTGDDAVRFGVSLPIPIFDQNQGGILAAQENLAKTNAERAANRQALLVVAGRAYDSVQGARRELAILRNSAIPKSRQAVDAMFEGYAQGRYSLIEILDAHAAVVQARLREQEALQNFHIGVATIEGLAGNPFTLGREKTR